MLIDSIAAQSRWRGVSPAAKAGFALAGLLAALLADSAPVTFGLALAFALITCYGAGVPARLWLRVACLPLGFLALSVLPLAFSWAPATGWHWAPDASTRMAEVLGRAAAASTALLLLVLSTPLADLFDLLRRVRCPTVLLDVMHVAYRMLAVLSVSAADMQRAQAARLGHVSTWHSLRSLGLLLACLLCETWRRAHDLERAAAARNGADGLRFLSATPAHPWRDASIALVASSALLAVVLGARL